MIKKWCHWGGNSIIVCSFGFAYFTFKQNRTTDQYTTLLIYFMFNTLNNNNNITRIIYLIKYPVPHFFSSPDPRGPNKWHYQQEGHSWLIRKGDITVAYYHALRSRNIPYGQTVRRYIYKTRWTEHNHLPILCYKLFSQVPTLCTCYRVNPENINENKSVACKE